MNSGLEYRIRELQSRLDVLKAKWDESKHPRKPKGSSGGGQFTSGGVDFSSKERTKPSPDGSVETIAGSGPVKHLFGTILKPMSPDEYSAFAGADDGSYIGGLGNDVVIYSPKRREIFLIPVDGSDNQREYVLDQSSSSGNFGELRRDWKRKRN